jgi:hypothetical protein
VVLRLSARDEGRAAGSVQCREGEADRVQMEYVTLPGADRARVPAPVPTADTSAPVLVVPGDSFVSYIVAPVRPSVSRNLSLARPSALERSLGTCPRDCMPRHRMEGYQTEMDRHSTH